MSARPWRARPWRDRDLVEGLAQAGQVELRACLVHLEQLRPRRPGERWDGPVRDALAGVGPGHAAAEHWARAEARWWSLAATAERLTQIEARRHSGGLLTTGLAVEDLASYGMVGAYRSAQTWSPAAGSGWPSYVTCGVVQEIRRQLRDRRRLGVAAQRHKVSLIKALDDLERRGQPAFIPWAAEWLELDPEYARQILDAGNEVRLDAGTDDGGQLRELLADDAWDPGHRIDLDRRTAALRRSLQRLPARERKILERRARGESLRAVGRHLGVSPEWVGQLERRARALILEQLVAAGFGPDADTDTERGG